MSAQSTRCCSAPRSAAPCKPWARVRYSAGLSDRTRELVNTPCLRNRGSASSVSGTWAGRWPTPSTIACAARDRAGSARPRSSRRHPASFSRSPDTTTYEMNLGTHFRSFYDGARTLRSPGWWQCTANRRHRRIGGCVVCQHKPSCPPWNAVDRQAARVMAPHPEQGWSLLCNAVVLLTTVVSYCPTDARCRRPGRLAETWPARGRSWEARVMAGSLLQPNDRPSGHHASWDAAMYELECCRSGQAPSGPLRSSSHR